MTIQSRPPVGECFECGQVTYALHDLNELCPDCGEAVFGSVHEWNKCEECGGTGKDGGWPCSMCGATGWIGNWSREKRHARAQRNLIAKVFSHKPWPDPADLPKRKTKPPKIVREYVAALGRLAAHGLGSRAEYEAAHLKFLGEEAPK